ncbi:MAG: hypothetical protein H0W90_10180 [Actinobacteria bacterium]|nr:hypothetical protein [Actinomycetota bacterium]
MAEPAFLGVLREQCRGARILAELIAATLNSVAFLWRTSPASTELEAHTLDWTAQLLGLPAGWHGHIEDTASVSTIAAAREANGGRASGKPCGSQSSSRHGSATSRAGSSALRGPFLSFAFGATLATR